LTQGEHADHRGCVRQRQQADKRDRAHHHQAECETGQRLDIGGDRRKTGKGEERRQTHDILHATGMKPCKPAITASPTSARSR
jgi:hypothetical protein